MHALAALATLVAALGLGLAAYETGRAVLAEPGAEAPPPAAEPATASEAAPGQAAPPPPSGLWPPLFGLAPPPAPPAPPPEAAPPAPAMPPLAALGYRLTGFVAGMGGASWVILAHPSGDLLLGIGDEIVPGVKLIEIAPGAVVFATPRGRDQLAFDPD